MHPTAYAGTPPCTDHPCPPTYKTRRGCYVEVDASKYVEPSPCQRAQQVLPPGTNLTPVGLLDAENSKSKVTKSSGSPFPAAGVLIHRGLVWYAKGDPSEDGDEVPCGRWKCIACENTKTAYNGDPPGGDPWGFGKATVHWGKVYGKEVSLMHCFLV